MHLAGLARYDCHVAVGVFVSRNWIGEDQLAPNANRRKVSGEPMNLDAHKIKKHSINSFVPFFPISFDNNNLDSKIMQGSSILLRNPSIAMILPFSSYIAFQAGFLLASQHRPRQQQRRRLDDRFLSRQRHWDHSRKTSFSIHWASAAHHH